MVNYTKQDFCRICGGELEVGFDLGDIYPSAFLTGEQRIEDFEPAPLTLCQCADCGLVQLQHTVNLDSMYRQYYYQSGINKSMVDALRDVVDCARLYVSLKAGDVVLDIASNDGTLLSFYPEDVTTIGVDPTLNIPRRFVPTHFINDYFKGTDVLALPLESKPKIVTTIAMFYDLPDPVGFTRDVAQILARNGIWIIQLNDLKSMLETNGIDAVCHEHLEYYRVADIQNLVERVGMEIFRIDHNGVNTGSLRFYVGFEGVRHVEPSVGMYSRIDQAYLESEEGSLTAFSRRISKSAATLVAWLRDQDALGVQVFGMAASTKGNTLLQAFGIRYPLLKAISDLNAEKFGRRTIATDIPVISEAEALEIKPDYLLVLSWGFMPYFLKSMQSYLRAGGALVTPLPEPTIYRWIDGHERSSLIMGDVSHGD